MLDFVTQKFVREETTFTILYGTLVNVWCSACKQNVHQLVFSLMSIEFSNIARAYGAGCRLWIKCIVSRQCF